MAIIIEFLGQKSARVTIFNFPNIFLFDQFRGNFFYSVYIEIYRGKQRSGEFVKYAVITKTQNKS